MMLKRSVLSFELVIVFGSSMQHTKPLGHSSIASREDS